MTVRVRTRFAPSPTGRLHLGNVRAAVFNWLFTRRHGGELVLRVEDTDVDRNVEGGEAGIVEDLRWLGLDWKEGPDVGGPHGPYRQSERAGRYDEAVESLLAAGKAYPCFCSEEDLEATAEVGKGGREVRRYSGRCRRLSPEERARRSGAEPTPVVRFAVPESGEGVHIQDEVYGTVVSTYAEIDDFVIRRSDGRVTYNFAVVVDDVDMEITHVIRGVGHLSNTPKQALVFDALGRARPVFAHLPTVLGPDGRKLSKREGASSVADLRAQGFPADGVLNYISLLGWSHPEEREVLSREELILSVSLDRVGRSDTQMDPEKLRWIASQHIAKEDRATLARNVAPFLDNSRFPGALEHLEAVVEALRTRLSTYSDINEHLPILFPPEGELATARAELSADPTARGVLIAVARRLESQERWEDEALSAAIREAGGAAGVKGAGLFHPVRRALIGTEKGPDLGKIIAAIGRIEALRRLTPVPGADAVSAGGVGNERI